ncbi:MAG TPA: aminotransferase class I/II-fold pyridoxal phosphate-dependent enzyme [Elusimicrobiota bacterium]|jgi:LL-diaminopimelate aminotransferase|nr:aminotransferase class I/II-fold pyridoxal phosphate-dependent enzyme [Elusimicrobiota bacterium]
MKPSPNKRLASLPPYIFVQLAGLKRKAQTGGLDVIDLGQGSPDMPTPPHVVEALRAACREPWTHRYPQANGTPEYRRSIAAWYKRRFDVDVDPETEVLPLIGSKEGMGHLFSALLDPGDVALVPQPCYPVHYYGVLLAGGKPAFMPLKEEAGFLPDLSKVPAAAARKAKFLILNYPNNPTGATLPDHALLKEALAFSRRHGCLVLYDNAYSEITFDGYEAPSILQLTGAKRHAVEFHSLSKTYSMAGWRLGFAVGNADAIAALAKFKGFVDYGVPSFLQKAGSAALDGPQDCVREACAEYQTRRDALVEALAAVGWTVPKPRAAMYIWARLPEPARKLGSFEFSRRLILEHGVVLAPGAGFGPQGEGYMRISLIAPVPVLREAASRVGRCLASLRPRR